MRAIALNLAILVLAGPVAADPRSEIAGIVGSMAAALADDNIPGFMAPFEKDMPEYDRLRSDVAALIGQAELTSDIEPVNDEGDAAKRSVDLDWTMQIRSREMAGPLVQRRQTIHVQLVKMKKGWRITSISPLDFFAPAKFSPSK